MVTMQADRPVATVTTRQARPAADRTRTHGASSPSRPVRLTRRGRIVVTALSALIIGLLSVTMATTAQAARPAAGAAGARTADRYVARIVVRPGQSLWAVAEAYDPNADTRLVIADIQQMNSLVSDQLQPGQTLWVPRS
jgi:LysM repeat protein